MYEDPVQIALSLFIGFAIDRWLRSPRLRTWLGVSLLSMGGSVCCSCTVKRSLVLMWCCGSLSLSCWVYA